MLGNVVQGKGVCQLRVWILRTLSAARVYSPSCNPHSLRPSSLRGHGFYCFLVIFQNVCIPLCLKIDSIQIVLYPGVIML